MVADGLRGQPVLVGVHADRPVTGLGGRFVDAGAGPTRRREDDVHAVVVHPDGRFPAARRIAEAGVVGRLAEVGHLDGGVRVGVPDARHVAGLELLEERDLHGADEARPCSSWS